MVSPASIGDDHVRGLERSEASAWREFYRAVIESTRDGGACGVRLGSAGPATVMIAAKADVLALNCVVGLGVDEPATTETIERIKEQFADVGVPRFFVMLSPVAAPAELPDLLVRSGFTHYNNWVKLYRDVSEPRPVETDLRVERIGPEHGPAFASIIVKSFGWSDDLASMIPPVVGRPGWHHYLAFDGDLPVGTAALHANDGYGQLCLAATLSEHRGRGAQSALIARRIRDAAALGCRHLGVETAEELPERRSPSYRNITSFGFRVAYVRPNYIHVRKKPE